MISKVKQIILENDKKIEKNALKEHVSPRTLWGKVIIYLREHHAVALHIACGDITDVEFDGNIFKINTEDEILYELLKLTENQSDLKLAFKSLDIENFEIFKKEKKVSKNQEDIKKLKEFFGEKLIIE